MEYWVNTILLTHHSIFPIGIFYIEYRFVKIDIVRPELNTKTINSINKPVTPTILKAKVASIIPNREIGEKLHISVEIVKARIRNIYSKYQVKNRFEVITLFSKGREGVGGN